MAQNLKSCARRRFLAMSAGAAGVAQLGSLLVAGPAYAQEKVDPADPLAVGLGYVHDGDQSARTDANERCGNCLQFPADETVEWGPCNIFAGRLVHGQGWCAVYVPKG